MHISYIVLVNLLFFFDLFIHVYLFCLFKILFSFDTIRCEASSVFLYDIDVIEFYNFCKLNVAILIFLPNSLKFYCRLIYYTCINLIGFGVPVENRRLFGFLRGWVAPNLP